MKSGSLDTVQTAGTTEPYAFCGDEASPLVATAIHAGHDLRPEVAEHMLLDDEARRREEDPHTDRIAGCAPAVLTVARSRFEVDLNRARDEAVYRTPDKSWGLQVWSGELPDGVVERSLSVYDAFYAELGRRLDRLAEQGPFVVFDVHSYNYRRQGPEAPGDPAVDSPDINVGTAALRGGWRPVVEAFIETLDGREVTGRALDVRENVRFKGANLSQWVAGRYRGTGCTLALEFKKAFMDEGTAEVDDDHLDELTAALRSSVPVVLGALSGAPG